MSTQQITFDLSSISIDQLIDEFAIVTFTEAMRNKLNKKRSQGRGNWWNNDYCSQQTLSTMLREHVDKGDPIDVALFAMMLYNRKETIIKE